MGLDIHANNQSRLLSCDRLFFWPTLGHANKSITPARMTMTVAITKVLKNAIFND